MMPPSEGDHARQDGCAVIAVHSFVTSAHRFLDGLGQITLSVAGFLLWGLHYRNARIRTSQAKPRAHPEAGASRGKQTLGCETQAFPRIRPRRWQILSHAR